VVTAFSLPQNNVMTVVLLAMMVARQIAQYNRHIFALAQ
jgi:hypothetical protein